MTQPAAGTNPVGASAVLSGAVKLVLLALVSIGVVPWSNDQAAAVTLALSAIVDAALYLGWIRPHLQQQLRAAQDALPPGAVRLGTLIPVVPPATAVPDGVTTVYTEPPSRPGMHTDAT
jgi:hypothetical protein